MPAILALFVAAVRGFLFSNLWSVRVAAWRYAKIMGPVTNIWWRPSARLVGFVARRTNVTPLDQGARYMGDFIKRIELYEDALHAEITRRHLWRPLFAAGVFHDVTTAFVAIEAARHAGKEHIEFQTAEGSRSFWAERRRRAPAHVYSGARYRERMSRPVIA